MNFTTEDEKVKCDDCGLVLEGEGEIVERSGQDEHESMPSTIGGNSSVASSSERKGTKSWKDNPRLQKALRRARQRESNKEARERAELSEIGSDLDLVWEYSGARLVNATP